MLAVAKNLP
jgi:hypothetical protein